MCLEFHKAQSTLQISWCSFSQNVYVASKALRMAFWDVSVDANTVFKTVCPCLKRFLFSLKSSISKDYIISHFLNSARTLTTNKKGTHTSIGHSSGSPRPMPSRRQFWRLLVYGNGGAR